MLLTSPRFPVRHGFSTRRGGVSQGPYASLNLGGAVGDEPERVAENAKRLGGAAGLVPGQLLGVTQVHGVALVEVLGAGRGEALPAPSGEADGLYTREPDAAVCVRTADCVPLLLYAPDAGAVAAVHAGWRGALAGIAGLAVGRLAAAYGARPPSVHALIGPSIRRCCYEVGGDLAGAFAQHFGEGVLAGGIGRPHLDLVEACRRSLEGAGVDPARIEVLAHCTCCEGEAFFSHRRDHGRTGRHLAFAVL